MRIRRGTTSEIRGNEEGCFNGREWHRSSVAWIHIESTWRRSSLYELTPGADASGSWAASLIAGSVKPQREPEELALEDAGEVFPGVGVGEVAAFEVWEDAGALDDQD